MLDAQWSVEDNKKMTFKILYASDLHGNEDLYNRLIEKAEEKDIKAVVLGGDLCPRRMGTLEQAISYQKDFLTNFFIPKLNELKKDVFFIMGNDDFRVNEPLFKNLKNDNLKYINKEKFSLSDKHIVGYSFVNPTPFRLKDWEKFDDEKKKFQSRYLIMKLQPLKKKKGQ